MKRKRKLQKDDFSCWFGFLWFSLFLLFHLSLLSPEQRKRKKRKEKRERSFIMQLAQDNLILYRFLSFCFFVLFWKVEKNKKRKQLKRKVKHFVAKKSFSLFFNQKKEKFQFSCFVFKENECFCLICLFCFSFQRMLSPCSTNKKKRKREARKKLLFPGWATTSFLFLFISQLYLFCLLFLVFKRKFKKKREKRMFVAFQHKRAVFHSLLIFDFICLLSFLLHFCLFALWKEKRWKEGEKLKRKEKRKRSFSNLVARQSCFFSFFFILQQKKKVAHFWEETKRNESILNKKQQKKANKTHFSFIFVCFWFVYWVFVWKEKEKRFLFWKREIEQFFVVLIKRERALCFHFQRRKEKQLSIVLKEHCFQRSNLFVCCFEKKELFLLRKFVVFKEMSCFIFVVREREITSWFSCFQREFLTFISQKKHFFVFTSFVVDWKSERWNERESCRKMTFLVDLVCLIFFVSFCFICHCCRLSREKKKRERSEKEA